MEALLTPDEMAKVLKTSTRTLERKRGDGSGPPFVKFGGRVLYPPEGAEDYIRERTVTSTAEAEAAHP